MVYHVVRERRGILCVHMKRIATLVVFLSSFFALNLGVAQAATISTPVVNVGFSMSASSTVIYRLPSNGKIYPLTTSTEASDILHGLALTISDSDLLQIPLAIEASTGTTMALRQKYAADIIYSTTTPSFLWYVSPVDLKRYYFDGSGTSLRFLGALDTNRPQRNFYIHLSTQVLDQRVGDEVLASYRVSTGKPAKPTPKGTFKTFYKNPRAWSKSAGLWMPYFQEFTKQGAGLHELPEWPGGKKEGADHLGRPVSHGCIRLGIGPAKLLYDWAPIGTQVIVVK